MQAGEVRAHIASSLRVVSRPDYASSMYRRSCHATVSNQVVHVGSRLPLGTKVRRSGRWQTCAAIPISQLRAAFIALHIERHNVLLSLGALLSTLRAMDLLEVIVDT